MKVSVVVPVWNPGPNLTRCVDSLLAQSMPADERELIFVDDGSTDGTAQRLDALAEREPIRVIHIPNSGWPGKPRNVGITAATGEYVHLVDNDDVLPPFALQTLYDRATEDAADVVMGRPASDFRGLNHTIYRADVRGGTLVAHPDLIETLTPHKMLRREFVLDHDIRFPEGPVPLEDQIFMIKAFVLAKSITVLTDRCYYFYLRRIGSGRNAGDRPIEAVRQCAATEQVLDIVEAEVADSALRDRLLRRFLRINLLARLSSRAMLDGSEELHGELFDEVHRLVDTRFSPAVVDGSGAAVRMQSHVLTNGDVDAMVELADRYTRIGSRAIARTHRWMRGALQLEVEGGSYLGDDPICCERDGDGWALPQSLVPGAPIEARRLDPARDTPDVELSVTSRVTFESYGSVDGLSFAVDESGRLTLRGRTELDPETFAAGRPLADGLWDVRLRTRLAGWNRAAAVRLPDPDDPLAAPTVTTAGRVVRLVRGDKSGTILLDVGQWIGSLAADVADRCEVEVDGRRLTLHVDASAAASAPVRIVLQPDDAGPQFVCTGTLEPGMTSVSLRLPRLPDGRWRLWLRLADPGAAPPVELPWQLVKIDRSTHAVRIQR